MHEFRVLIALAIAALLAVGPRASTAAGFTAAGPAGGAARVEALDATPHQAESMVASPATPVAAPQLSGREASSSPRPARGVAHGSSCPPQRARIAALTVSRLAYARALDAARIGYFSFGSTAPPLFHG